MNLITMLFALAVLPPVVSAERTLPVDAQWTRARLAKDALVVGKDRYALPPDEKAAAALGKQKVILDIDQATAAPQVLAVLLGLHKAGVKETGLLLTVGGKEVVLGFCAADLPTCFGQPWNKRGARVRTKPKLSLTDSEMRLSGRRMRAVVITPIKGAYLAAPLRTPLLEVEDRVLLVRATGGTYAQLATGLALSPLPVLAIDGAQKKQARFAGFDDILGELPLDDISALPLGEQRASQGEKLGRKGVKKNVADVALGSRQAGAVRIPTRSDGPVRMALTVDDGLGDQKLAKTYMRGVSAALQGATAAMQECYIAAREKDENLRGSIRILFRVGVDGVVKNAKIVRDRLQSKAVAKCVLKELRGVRFPDSPNGDEVVLTNTFAFEADPT